MSSITAHTPLQPVIKVQGRAVVHLRHRGPAFCGGGTCNYTCPHCGKVLAESVAESSIFDLVVQCGDCDKLSEFDRLPPGAKAAGYVFMPARQYRFSDTVNLAKATFIVGEGSITGGGTPQWN